MAEKHVCPYCQKECKTATAVASHIKYKHPGELGLPKHLGEEPPGEKEVPDAARDFELLLDDYGVTKAPIIVKNIAATGSPNIFDDPKELARKLAKWPRDMAPMYRASILEHWFKSRGIILPEELLEEVGMEEEEKKAKDKKAEAEKKRSEGALWAVEIDDSGTPKIRMIRGDSEPGVTLAEAKLAAKEIAKEHEEPIVVYNEALGRYMPNFKSSFVRQNLGAALYTARQMDKSMSEGETVDPMDIWLDQQAKLTQMKEMMGITPETRGRETITDVVEAIKILQGTVPGGKGSISEVVDALKAFQELTTQARPDSVGESLKAELAEMRKIIDELRDQAHKQEITSLQQQIQAQAEAHKRQIDEILSKMEGLKSVVGRTEMDILYEVASKGIDVVKTEAAGMRGMIKEVVGGAGLPPPKTPEEREQRKGKYRQALQTDREIEELGDRLFLSQS